MAGGAVDVHAHIIPGVDDGSRSMEESETMLRLSLEQGFCRVIATPHFHRRQDAALIKERLEELKERAEAGGLEISVALGQEILFHEGILEDLEAGRAFSMAGSRYVLVEFLPEDSYSRLTRAVRLLVQAGYLPIAAHAERYACLREGERLRELAENGAYIQMNYRSLEGNLLNGDVRWCRRQLLAGNVHFLGTDMHRSDWRPPQTERARAWILAHAGEAVFTRLSESNPQCILEDKAI